MKNKFLLALIFFLFCSSIVFADIGPKPSMSFNLVYETSAPVELLSGKQIECKDKDCIDSRVLVDSGLQFFECQQNYCRSQAYFDFDYSDYHKLVLEFSDKTRESNIFLGVPVLVDTNFYGGHYEKLVYTVRVTDSGLIVSEAKTEPADTFLFVFLVALLLTLAIELVVAFVFLHLLKLGFSPRFLLSVLASSIISMPILWFLFIPLFSGIAGLGVVLGEIFVFLFEAGFIYFLNKKFLPFKKVLLLSLVMNLVSFAVGLFILPF